VLLGTIGIASCTCPKTPETGGQRPALDLVDSGGRSIKALEVGSSLETGARGLKANGVYEYRVTLDGKLISFARLAADRNGTIEPFILWYQSGVVGCSLTERQLEVQRRPLAFRDFDEAERALQGRRLAITLREAHPLTRTAQFSDRPAAAAATARRPVAPADTTIGKLVAQTDLPIVRLASPMVYPATKDGCLLNAALTGSQDMFVSGRNFKPGELIDVSVVPNQRRWHVGDDINDVTGVSGAAASERVRADANGRFTIMAWKNDLQRRGAYDIVAHPVSEDASSGHPRVAANDTVSYGSDTGYILFLYYPPGGSQMDIAGRPLVHFPYFEFSDSFTANEDVWGAVDPTYIPAGHPGGTYAAYYVVNHKSAAEWMADNTLTDVSGVVEVMPVKSWCVNGTDVVIWHAPTRGDYDVVVNFGATPAEATTAFVDDYTYDSAIDFLDGAVQIGFRVADDPYDLGSIPIGQAEYSYDDYLFLSDEVSTNEGGAPGSTNVDLRAIVRYPATAAGTNTPVQPGAHPIFVIEHGNHDICRDMSYAQNHAGCPVNQRVPNHLGYMHLLDALASHGIIAVSIDAYDLTGWVPQWTAERGDLILKHLEFWSHLNNAATYASYSDPFGGLFTGHVDMAKISVSGHSRGGEASVSAYVRNLLRPVAQQFAIGSVSSIAPVDSGIYSLGDVPYFVILPAADCDVSDLGGQRIYDRGGGAGNVTVKSGIYVYGADHNFFNTVWADDGDDCEVIWGLTSRDDYILKADQQKIGEAYLAAFVRSQLLGQDVYEDMLRGRMRFPSFAGRKIYTIRHDKSHHTFDDGTAAGVPGGGATEAAVVNPSPHQTAVDRLSWNSGAQTYTYTIVPTNVTGFEVLSFRVAQTASAVNPATGQEFMVSLTGGGNTRATYTAVFAPIPPPYNHPVPSIGTSHTVMTTVRIPLHSFIMNNSHVDLTAIDTVQFRFNNPTQGEIYVDDVEFSR
jgi:hypothetical protein